MSKNVWRSLLSGPVALKQQNLMVAMVSVLLPPTQQALPKSVSSTKMSNPSPENKSGKIFLSHSKPKIILLDKYVSLKRWVKCWQRGAYVLFSGLAMSMRLLKIVQFVCRSTATTASGPDKPCSSSSSSSALRVCYVFCTQDFPLWNGKNLITNQTNCPAIQR